MRRRIKQAIIGTPLQPVVEDAVRAPLAMLRAMRRPETMSHVVEEGAVRTVMRHVIGRDTDCLDVGCHLGSVLATMQRLAPGGRHVGVEATPQKAKRLAAKFKDATILPYAAGEAPGEVTFYVRERAAGYNGLTEIEGASPITVPMRRLDDVLPDGFAPGFVKIDVEGAELQALKGLSATLSAHRPVILFECAVARPLEGGGYEGDDLYDHLTNEAGYDVFGPMDLLHGRPPFARDEFRRRRTYPSAGWNHFAVPRERGAVTA